MVVIAILIFDDRKGALVATVALGLFDIFNGYAAEVWITILESLIVCLVLYLVFEKLLKSNDKIVNVIIAGVIAALTKIILNFVKYTKFVAIHTNTLSELRLPTNEAISAIIEDVLNDTDIQPVELLSITSLELGGDDAYDLRSVLWE